MPEMKVARAWARGVQVVGVVALIAAGAAAGCGGGGNGFSNTGGGDDGGSSGGMDAGDGGNLLGGNSIKSVTISPPNAAITSVNGQPVSQQFSLSVQLSDGTSSMVSSGVSWTSDSAAVGTIGGGSGLYQASGALGGTVAVSASYMGHKASATLIVKLLLQENPGNVPGSVQSSLQNASTPDANVVWAYPYDGTVWARGLLAPTLQWNGGAATDDYYVHVVSPTFELQEYTAASGAPSSQVLLDAAAWTKFTDSTSGAATLTVARWDGNAATVIAKHGWTVAPASIRGTIYYWSNNLGRVLRIKPGAMSPDDFANQAPLDDPNQYQQDSCLMTCHAVSADGSTLVSGGGTYAGSYDLGKDQPILSLGGTWGSDPNNAGVPVWKNIQWEVPALSPDGKYILVNSMAQNGVSDYNGPGTLMGLFSTADGSPVANSGVQGMPFDAPAWSPDGTKVAYVDSGDPTTWNGAGYNWQNPPPGDLKVIAFDAKKNPMFSGPQTMVPVGMGGQAITWPSVSPDGSWVIYARAGSFDTRNGPGDLYFASAVTPNQEVRLAKVDGDGYPFAAGARDLSFNYEPSFAPVAAGGYFWAVFTSRRTYGNTLTGDKTVVKQLWVTAIDQNPKPGVDPSHPAFHLQGQDEGNLAMRGFMSLPPCEADGATCTSGTDCCCGYCVTGDAGTPVCGCNPGGCAQNGDKCNTTADCCNAGTGVTCIAHVCSEPTPQ